MALRRMAAAFRGWRYLTAYRAHARAVVEQSVVRLSQRALAAAWQGWQEFVAERRVVRHRIAVCQRRHQLALVRGAFAGWREAAALQGAERQIVQLCQRRADRNRWGPCHADGGSGEATCMMVQQYWLLISFALSLFGLHRSAVPATLTPQDGTGPGRLPRQRGRGSGEAGARAGSHQLVCRAAAGAGVCSPGGGGAAAA